MASAAVNICALSCLLCSVQCLRLPSVTKEQKVAEVCARHDAEYADLYQGPPTFRYLLSQRQFCDDSFMAPHLTSRNITFDPSRSNGDCNKFCGCRHGPKNGLYCPCAKYKILNLMAVAGYFLNRHDLSWFFYKGTAIGALRNGGFMPYDQDHDADWGVILENEKDVDRFVNALREIDDFIRARDYPHRGFVSYQISNTDFRELGSRNEAWIMSYSEDAEAARNPGDSRPGENNASKVQSHNAGKTNLLQLQSRICFENKLCDEPVFLNAKLDVVGCVPIRNSTHDIVQCGSSLPTQYERADVLPLIECQFYGEAWPCPNQTPKLIEKYYDDSFLRQHYPGDFEPNGTSLECLQNNGWPSFLVCPNAEGDKFQVEQRHGQKCDRLAPEVSRAYRSGSMPTNEIQKLAGL